MDMLPTPWEESYDKLTQHIIKQRHYFATNDPCSQSYRFSGRAQTRKAMTNLDSILKSRDITLPAKVCIIKGVIFPITVMYGCKSRTIQKGECRRINAFYVWCWRRLLRVSQTAKRSSQSILKEINTEYSLEGLMLKLKLQYFDHLM